MLNVYIIDVDEARPAKREITPAHLNISDIAKQLTDDGKWEARIPVLTLKSLERS
jgi:hypothetical protein